LNTWNEAGDAAYCAMPPLGLRELVSTLLCSRNAAITSAYLNVPVPILTAHGRVEVARVRERTQLLRACALVMSGWPQSFRALAEKTGLTQRAFVRMMPLPQWLDAEVRHLPKGRSRSSRQDRKTLAAQIALLDDERSTNWRARRAALMLQSIRQRS
jgi:hypothetical protein